MDIVSRIKTFLSVNGISNSVFADNCDIPRPTLSQLLNGRNKKVSNEVLDKIHVAYPELSIMWLMFGEGEMQSGIGKNITDDHIASFSEVDEFDNVFSEASKNEPEVDNDTMSDVLQSLSKKMIKNRDRIDDTGMAKRIVNVMVFYSDNSFESFVPNK